MGSTTTQILYALTVATTPTRAAPEDASKKSHHAESGFRNPWDSWRDVSLKSVGEVMMRRLTGKANVPDTSGPTVPVRKPEFLPSRDTPRLRATWLGHAAYYIEFPSGLRVLFDPVLEERCGPYNMLGPKRFTDAPCKPTDIPLIDAVVISHNHYDHLSYHTVTAIAKKHPNCHFFVPLGNKTWFQRCGIEKVTELDWWEECDITLSPTTKETKVEAAGEGHSEASEITARLSSVPCQHVSARGPFDRNKTLWCSWAIESEGKKVYFAGDTGYRPVTELPEGEDDHDPKYDFPVCPAFKQVGEFRGPFDLGLIPIGAYAPRHVWSPAHGDPHDAVSIFQDTKCKNALGIHWGTWVLTEEDVLEPPEKLKTALKRFGLPEKGVFDVVDIGESREY
ncbi:N-acyl-phosphatidylethanolamine-hydrolyzing phospholipase D [Penicillium longicatenatum]|uniref:N-acyl-phosphatidylethanolamine-hydrolyzing phospholipase D n=1 Tax=Penicillium longicatenatum TaxID=1561947 RepID=UPI0025491D67|nr:N-acyl-phosphatidylethanolamine-hydrolyzing phospholipase D [Penicillium longicatenatum]KAJ5643625.1 N-acyl-phosphatidylethanolamine-hydrolyzing phospholipase D [Penicillium longicatenatum]KAJ5645010.1 N-acyl-phosphatidylethanolamine-hydrolyzing phospholipase D [Penicillium longicatenatum]